MFAESPLFRKERRALQKEPGHVVRRESCHDPRPDGWNELARVELATIDISVEPRGLAFGTIL